MADPISTSISLAALITSAATAWLTLFRRGTIRMTKPTFVAFAYDHTPRPERPKIPKVFLRALIYSTGKRGQIIENMFIALRRDENEQIFNVWGYLPSFETPTTRTGVIGRRTRVAITVT